MELRVDRKKCQGHGKCYLALPQVFAPDVQDDWGRSTVLEPVVAENDNAALVRAREAVSLCPEFAIHLEPLAPTEQVARRVRHVRH